METELSPQSESGRSVKNLWLAARIPVFCLMVYTGLAAFYQWSNAAYRFCLFVFECGCRLNVNHANDFAEIDRLNTIAVPLSLVVFLYTLFCIRRKDSTARQVALILLIANLAGWAAFFIMHRTGVLITYEEYIRHGV